MLILAVFILFCRIGGCLMVMPGFSSPRVPMRARLLGALGLTLALSPLLLDRTVAAIGAGHDIDLVILILSESAVGGTIGLLARILFAALETMLTAAAMSTGFGNVFSARLDEGESLPEFAAIVMNFAVTLFFLTDQHTEVVRALADSYRIAPPGQLWNAQAGLVQVVDMLGRAFPLALQVASPFLLYGLLANLALGLLNRLTPQIPIYFLSTPFVIAGGLAILYVICGPLLTLFMDGFHGWLTRG